MQNRGSFGLTGAGGRQGTLLALVLLLEESFPPAPGTFPGIEPEVGIDLFFKEALSLNSI
jgi:hypothetical protein